MASFSVAWTCNNGGRSKLSPVQNLEELHGCLGHSQSLRPGMMYGKNFLNYKSRNHEICKAQKLNAVVVNKFAETRMDSSTKSGEYASLLNHLAVTNVDNKIYPQKRMIDKEEDVSGKLDQWVKDSVVEILNNLDEAPFLVHIYSDDEKGSPSTDKNKLVKEKAVAESWPLIKERWGGGSPAPNGIILVEEVKSNEAAADSMDEENSKTMGMSNKPCSSTKVWGILIQGKGANYPACYILKTNRVPCLAGFCTHFCLVRVECFVENVDILFKKLWLL